MHVLQLDADGNAQAWQRLGDGLLETVLWPRLTGATLAVPGVQVCDADGRILLEQPLTTGKTTPEPAFKRCSCTLGHADRLYLS